MSCSCESCHNHEHEHGHEHHHNHEHKQQSFKITVIKLIAAAVFFAAALCPLPTVISALLYAVSILIAAYDILLDGAKALMKLRPDEEALLLIAVAASFALGEYAEAAMVTVLFKVGTLLENYAVSKSKKSTDALAQIRPDTANLIGESGEIENVPAQSVQKGSVILLRPGDRIPLDCIVTEGRSGVDTSAVTGESEPLYAQAGTELLSGCVNIDGVLTCRTVSDFESSAASKIVEMVYNSAKNKGKSEKFITRFSRIYTPAVIISALLLAVIPPLFGIHDFKTWILRALIFLVASCPCALVISVPLSFFSTVGALSKAGVLTKGSSYVELLAKVKAVAFDKTGTLTSGELTVDKETSKIDRDELIRLAASAEQFSSHPAAKAIVRYAGTRPLLPVESANESAGLGVTAVVDGRTITCGSARLMEGIADLPPADIYVSENNRLLGCFTLKEDIPKHNRSIATQLQALGVQHAVMLTGAGEAAAKSAADVCGITEYHHSLLPEGKVDKIKELQNRFGVCVFVGDGINDAPVLARSDVGVSMGLGSEIANASSDMILAGNRLSDITAAIRISKRGMRIMRANVIFALAVKLIVLILGALGLAQMWMAVFADIGVTLITVLNSIRILKIK